MKIRLIITTTLTLTALLGAAPIVAQQATERFIPIGKSPGLSGSYTWMGEITRVDVPGKTFTVANEGGERTITITDTTRIWVDQSAQGRQNTVGSISDLQVGRRTEIKYVDRERRDVADWIKVASG